MKAGESGESEGEAVRGSSVRKLLSGCGKVRKGEEGSCVSWWCENGTQFKCKAKGCNREMGGESSKGLSYDEDDKRSRVLVGGNF